MSNSYFGEIGAAVKTLAVGMKTTLKEYFTPKSTEQYPENRKTTLHVSARHRGRLVFKRDENGASKCVACTMCEKACPNGTIKIVSEMVENPETGKKKRQLVDYQYDMGDCMFCQLCVNACNFDAIHFVSDNANAVLNCRMAEYAKAVISGRPSFHISLVQDISPNCDCHCENDAPILPDIGMFASFDPLALDQACVDACLDQQALPGSQLWENLRRPGFADWGDPFTNSTPNSEWRSCLEHAEKIGLGVREYEIIRM